MFCVKLFKLEMKIFIYIENFCLGTVSVYTIYTLYILYRYIYTAYGLHRIQLKNGIQHLLLFFFFAL